MAKMTKERKNLSIGLLIFTAVIIATAVMGIILLKPSTEYIEGQADVEEYRVSSKVPSRIVTWKRNCNRHKPPKLRHRHKATKHATEHAKNRFRAHTACGRKQKPEWK